MVYNLQENMCFDEVILVNNDGTLATQQPKVAGMAPGVTVDHINGILVQNNSKNSKLK
jgi:hypothetical protein